MKKRVYLTAAVVALIVAVLVLNHNLATLSNLTSAVFGTSDGSLKSQLQQVFSKKSGEDILKQLLSEVECDTTKMERFFSLESNTIELTTTVPKGRPLPWLVWHFSELSDMSNYSVFDCVHQEYTNSCTMEFSSNQPKKPDIRLRFSFGDRYMSDAGKIALVITDFRFDTTKNSVGFLSFARPLNLTIHPVVPHPYSLASKIANKYNKEVIIALPLEPQSLIPNEYSDATIMVHYSRDKIRKMMSHAIDRIPNFSGMTNYMGSRAMQDSRCMKTVLSQIHAHHGYFLEQGDIYNSKAREVAQSIGCAWRKTDMTISDSPDEPTVEAAFREAIMHAHTYGDCILTAPRRVAVIEVLNRMRDVFDYNGIAFVYVSSLAQ